MLAPAGAIVLALLGLLLIYGNQDPGTWASGSGPAAGPGGPPTAAAPVLEFGSRRAMLEAQVAQDPEDHRAAVRLASCLIIAEQRAATERVLDRERHLGSPSGGELELEVAATLRRSPDVATAERLARRVAARSPDAQLRGRAWRLLAVLHRYRLEPAGRIRCLREALRECPSDDRLREVLQVETARAAGRQEPQ